MRPRCPIFGAAATRSSPAASSMDSSGLVPKIVPLVKTRDRWRPTLHKLDGGKSKELCRNREVFLTCADDPDCAPAACAVAGTTSVRLASDRSSRWAPTGLVLLAACLRREQPARYTVWAPPSLLLLPPSLHTSLYTFSSHLSLHTSHSRRSRDRLCSPSGSHEWCSSSAESRTCTCHMRKGGELPA